uniref:Uncharacterized protein n=1 Tax=Glossina palpalis gambiensis TaxID=67801 RepID=A0A1B0AQE7_9MUSC
MPPNEMICVSTTWDNFKLDVMRLDRLTVRYKKLFSIKKKKSNEIVNPYAQDVVFTVGLIYVSISECLIVCAQTTASQLEGKAVAVAVALLIAVILASSMMCFVYADVFPYAEFLS